LDMRIETPLKTPGIPRGKQREAVMILAMLKCACRSLFRVNDFDMQSASLCSRLIISFPLIMARPVRSP
jgi:hypothetical protein